MDYAIALLLLVCVSVSNAGLKCPENLSCQCSPPSGTTKLYKIYCPTELQNGTGFYMTMTPSYLHLECRNAYSWKNFMPDSHLDLNEAFALTFSDCDLPDVGYNYKFLEQLKGISRIKNLNVTRSKAIVKKHQIDIFPSVETLVLSNNFLGNVSDDFLHGFPNLTNLYLYNTSVRISARFFEKASRLRYLDLGKNSLSTLDLWPGIFDRVKHTRLLNLTHNNFTHFEPKVFRGLNSLEVLDFSNVHLETLSSGILDDLVNLIVIHAGGNFGLRVREGAFATNRQLRHVHLENNGIQNLPPKFFADFFYLRNVVLHGNSLTTLPEDIFWGSYNITELVLRNNTINTLPSFLLKDAHQLRVLDLSSNNLTNLPDIFFANTSSLLRLNLAKNSFKTLSNTIYSLSSLEALNMEDNELRSISPEACHSLPNLRFVHLARNHLNFRDSQVARKYSPFHNCTYLGELDLSGNAISEAYDDWTLEIGQLYKLNLSRNDIRYIEVSDPRFMTHELTIDLTHNKIAIVNISLIEERLPVNDTTNGVITINMNANPIECYCEIFSLLRYAYGKMKPEVYRYMRLRHEDVRCALPTDLEGSYMGQLLDKELECSVANGRADSCAAGGVCDCLAAAGREAFSIDCSSRNLTKPPAWINNWDTRYNISIALDLSGNRLRRFPNLTKVGYENVNSLNLGHNEIAWINDELSLLMPKSLKSLNLEFNKLRKIDVMTMGNLSQHLDSLRLRGNPWQCDHKSADFRHYVEYNRIMIIDDAPEVTCFGTNPPEPIWNWMLRYPGLRAFLLGLAITVTIVSLLYQLYWARNMCGLTSYYQALRQRYWEG